MKVALVNPGKDPRLAICEPLNLGYLASSILSVGNHEVRIIDELAGDNVNRELRKINPDIVGITANTPLITRAYEIAHFCRSQNYLIVMGGVHVTIPDCQPEALKYCDLIVASEGEKAIKTIVTDLSASTYVQYSTGKIINGDHYKNLDDIPPPARHLINMDYYKRVRQRIPGTFLQGLPKTARVAMLLTSRGCPYRCIFCWNSWRKVPLRFHSAERVLYEMNELKEHYDVNGLFIGDDHFFLHKRRLHDICKNMIERDFNFNWICNSRVDSVDYKSLKLAKDAGCVEIIFGFESGSQRVLDVLNKQQTVKTMSKAIKMCKDIGIKSSGTFMIGNPTEKITDVRRTQKFIIDHDIDNIGLCVTTPFPGTILWEICKRKGMIPNGFNDWNSLRVDRISSISACDTMDTETVEMLYYETEDLVMKKTAGRIEEIRLGYVMGLMFRYPSIFIEELSRMLRGKNKLLRIKNYLKRVQV